MNSPGDKEENEFSAQITRKEKRKVRARGVSSGTVWTGLGMFGMIGWSVTVPTLLGVALGLWLDKSHPESFSWTLTLLMVGLIAGCVIAWFWVAKEDKEMHQHKNDKDE